MNSYISYYYSDPAPLQMAWTLKNSGRRFLGCYNFKTRNCAFFKLVDKKMEPCERVYNFYMKIQNQKMEMEKLTKKALLHEFNNEQLEKKIEN